MKTTRQIDPSEVKLEILAPATITFGHGLVTVHRCHPHLIHVLVYNWDEGVIMEGTQYIFADMFLQTRMLVIQSVRNQ